MSARRPASAGFRDALTGLYNRRYATLRLEEEGRRQARFGEPLSLVLFGVDRLKDVNDAVGRHGGDATLCEVAHLLLAQSRSFAIVTRWGGDTFAVLLVNTPKPCAVQYAQRIRAAIDRHGFAHAPITVSVGVAALPDDVATGADLAPAAEQAMERAKRAGRNAIRVA